MDLAAQAQQGFATVQVDDSVKEQALKNLRRWLTDAEFADYRPQLQWLVEQQQWTGLLDRFYQILPFGTGGRRGAVGVGPNRMNPWTLTASVQGHAEYLKERFPGLAPLRVVVSYDVRCFLDQRKNYNPGLPNPVLRLSSKDFAQQAASVYAANGIHVSILPPESNRFLATPELSFTIRYLQAHGGLNISASHNPPDDNGGKFYDERGGQPVPPDDQIMADLVDQVTVIRTMPWHDAVKAGRIHFLDQTPHQAYLELIRHQSLVPAPRFDEIEIVFTPLHGVGSMTAMEALVAQGFRVTGVTEQMQPDGQFTHVTKSPNPEVPESMDRAVELARKLGADLVLATDPDADRLGGMAPDRAGEWRFVTGNQIVSLLTFFKLSRLAERGEMPGSPIVVKTEVTTEQISRIARHFGAQLVDDLLVGFKYIGDVLWQLEQKGSFGDVRGTPADFIIGCEESHGILVTPKIRDKDAAGGALLLAELVLYLKRQGKTLFDYLDQIQRKFGYYRNDAIPVVMTGILGKQNMLRMLDALRRDPPREIGGLAVTRFEDLRDEAGRLGPLRGATDASARNVLTFRLGEQARLILRPSGTEPKAKTYLEVCSAPCPAGTGDAAWQKTCHEVDALAARLADDFLALSMGKIGLQAPSR